MNINCQAYGLTALGGEMNQNNLVFMFINLEIKMVVKIFEVLDFLLKKHKSKNSIALLFPGLVSEPSSKSKTRKAWVDWLLR